MLSQLPAYRFYMTFFYCFLLLFSNVLKATEFNLEQAKKDYHQAEFKLASVEEGVYDNAPAIIASFTVPLDLNSLNSNNVSLKEGKDETQHYDAWVWSQDRTQVIFPFVKPSTDYQVAFAPTVLDINQQPLQQNTENSLTIRAIEAQAVFASKGHVIAINAPLALPINVVNIDDIDVNFHKLEGENIHQFLYYMNGSGDSYSYYLKNYLKGELLHSARYQTKGRKNQRRELNLDFSHIQALKQPGIYVAVMKVAGQYKDSYQYTYFMRSNLGLHIRANNEKHIAFVQDISTGKPLKHIEVSALDQDFNLVVSKTSDDLGKVEFDSNANIRYISSQTKQQYSFIDVRRNALDLSAMNIANNAHQAYQFYAWGPRDLYRPNEAVTIDILLRDSDGKQTTSNAPINYSVYKPQGGIAKSGTLQALNPGYFRLKLPSQTNVETGTYRVNLTYASHQHNYEYKVEAFLPERLELHIGDDAGINEIPLKSQPELSINVNSDYLYGAPASGNRLDGKIQVAVNPHIFKHLPHFYFADDQTAIPHAKQNLPAIKLDAEGKGQLSFNNAWQNIKTPLRIALSASVYESGGRPVTRHRILTLTNQKHFIGIEPQFKDVPNYNSAAQFKIGYADESGQWQANNKLTATLIRTDRQWFWRNSNERGWHWDYESKPQTVFAKQIVTKKGETSLINLPLKWGNYQLVVSDGQTSTRYSFKTQSYYWGNAVYKDSLKPDQVSLSWDKTNYQAGDTAALTIMAPSKGHALLTIESSEGLLWQKYIEVDSKASAINIPTKQQWQRHDLYATVMVIKPMDNIDSPIPNRAFGLIHLPLKRQNRLLKVSIDAPEKAQPLKKLKAKIKVEQATKTNDLLKNTKVIVALSDTGVLNITRFATPDAEKHLFEAKAYQHTLYDNYGHIIDNSKGKLLSQRFGGGFMKSSAQLAKGGEEAKSDVNIVSFVSTLTSLNEEDEAEIEFDIPQFNGQLRWMVMAFNDEQYGHTDAKSTIADKVVTQLSMPRFLAKGDEATLALDIRNMNGSDLEMSINLGFSEGVKLSSQVKNELTSQDVLSKQLLLEDQKKQTLSFDISAISDQKTGIINLALNAKDPKTKEQFTIKRQWKLATRSAYPAISRSTYKTIKKGETWPASIKIDDLDLDSVNFQLNISDQFPIDFSGHFSYLLNYPYGCLEQSTSSGYPWVLMSPNALKEFNLEKNFEQKFKQNYEKQFRLDQVNRAVERILAKQKRNGSFGLWDSNSAEEAWLTAYASEFLFQAKALGAAVNKQSLNKAVLRLRTYVLKQNQISSRYSQDNEHFNFAYRSYAAYVLAKYKNLELSYLRRLHDEKMKRLAHVNSNSNSSNNDNIKAEDDGLSWTYMSAALKLAGDHKRSKAAYDKALTQIRLGDQYYGEYGSAVRDQSRMISTIIEENLGEYLDLIIPLAKSVKQRRYLSTQERINLFKLAVLLNEDKTQGTDTNKQDHWQADLISAEMTQNLKQISSFNTLFQYPLYESLEGVKSINKTLYARLNLSGHYQSAPSPVNQGYQVSRRFFSDKGEELSLDKVSSGQIILVEVRVKAEQQRPDSLLVELLPAGMELENQNLANASINMDDLEIDGKKISSLKSDQIKHQEFRDDRYIAAFNAHKYGEQKIYYLMRAVTPGQYTLPPSYVEDMYSPDFFAIGDSGHFEVQPK